MNLGGPNLEDLYKPITGGDFPEELALDVENIRDRGISEVCREVEDYLRDLGYTNRSPTGRGEGPKVRINSRDYLSEVLSQIENDLLEGSEAPPQPITEHEGYYDDPVDMIEDFENGLVGVSIIGYDDEGNKGEERVPIRLEIEDRAEIVDCLVRVAEAIENSPYQLRGFTPGGATRGKDSSQGALNSFDGGNFRLFAAVETPLWMDPDRSDLSFGPEDISRYDWPDDFQTENMPVRMGYHKDDYEHRFGIEIEAPTNFTANATVHQINRRAKEMDRVATDLRQSFDQLD